MPTLPAPFLLEARQFQTHRFMESHLTDLTDCRHRWWEYMQPIFFWEPESNVL